MFLPIDYCPDPSSLLRLSQGIREYEQLKGLCVIAAARGFTEYIQHQRETQLEDLRRLADIGNELAMRTLAAYYLDNAYGGTILHTWSRFDDGPPPSEQEGMMYAAAAKSYVKALIERSADADYLCELSHDLRDKRWLDGFKDLYRRCLETAGRKGSTEAQTELAGLYLHGDIGLKPNRKLGLHWLRKAAAANAEAAAWLAELEHPTEL